MHCVQQRKKLCVLPSWRQFQHILHQFCDELWLWRLEHCFARLRSPPRDGDGYTTASQQELRRLYSKVDGAPTSPVGFNDPPKPSRKRAR